MSRFVKIMVVEGGGASFVPKCWKIKHAMHWKMRWGVGGGSIFAQNANGGSQPFMLAHDEDCETFE